MTIDELKAQIDSTIKSNGQRLITGAQLNSILNAIATYTAEVEGVSLKVPQFLPFDSIIANANVQVGSTSATDYEIVYVESKNVFTAYTGGVYYTDWVGSLSYNKGTFSKSAIATNLYINPYAEIYKIENSKLVAIQKYDIANVVATYGDGGSWATLSYKGSTIYPETKGQQVKLSIGGNADDAIKQNSSNIVKEKERAQQVEMYLESQKANKYGYYENLSVGVSDNLSGRGEATESEFAMRPSGGENKSIEDGTARINSIKGNSVVYNQFVNNFNGLVDKQLTDNFDYEITGDEIILTCHTGGVLESVYLFGAPFGANISVGDKVYASIECKTSFDCVIRVYPAFNDIGLFNPDSSYKKYSFIGTIKKTPSQVTYLYITFGTLDGLSLNVGDEIRFKKPQFTNLTKMFNGVNEPTTVEEFEALYGNMPNEYNEGTIIDNHTTAIKSVGVNAWDGQLELGMYDERGKVESGNYNRSKNPIRVIGGAKYYFSSQINGVNFQVYYYDANMNCVGNVYWVRNYEYTIPNNAYYMGFYCGSFQEYIPENNDICIHLVHTGYLNGKYFPYESQTRELPTVEGGLKSAGTAYDEIRYNKSKDKWEHVQRIGSVYLDTLDWGISPTGTDGIVRFYSSEIAGAVPVSNSGEIGNIICDKYVSINAGSTWSLVKGVAMNFDVPRLFIYDSAYTDVATFKQAMQGVILYYELAKPKVTELDVDISPDYKVWDYGTEEAISEVLSTPVRINANYGFNAVGQITDNTELIKELLARVAVLEAQIAQM